MFFKTSKGEKLSNVELARGMSADQVLRAAIVMRLFEFTYEELAFHISDSRCLQRFCRIGFADKGFKKSALNANIRLLGLINEIKHFVVFGFNNG